MIPLVLVLLAQTPGFTVRDVVHQGARFQVVTVDTTTVDLSIRQERRLALTGPRLFATNAGIFEPGFTPTGLLVVDGRIEHPLNRAPGSGNFYLQPNGVFFVLADGSPQVLDTEAFATSAPKAVAFATQSGPLLVHHAAINAAFTPGSKNRNLRSGVGVRGHVVHLVLSVDEVSFHTLASLFLDELKVDEALYLDGFISELAAKGLTAARAPSHDFAALIVGTPRTR